MKLYIGIDLGTSAVKLLLMDEAGSIKNIVTKEYPLEFPQPGWSQQDPEDWKRSVLEGLPELLDGFDKSKVRGIGCGGQMHGLVLLDEECNVLRRSILWCDGRTTKQCKEIEEIIGRERLIEITANPALEGFTAGKILWVKENEPDNFEKICKIMLPKDYLAYRLSGVFATDYSDASGMLLLDVKNRCWNEQMCQICGVDKGKLPKLYESYEKIGTLLPSVAKELGLNESTSISIGAGDNAAAAVGTGTVGNGSCNISLGTSGTVFVSQDKFSVDKANALHSFCHSNGAYHLMGCILSAASCNKWWVEDILGTSDFANEEKNLDKLLGDNATYFLPYLMGERSPHNDVDARGAFIGMRPDTTREHMVLAVLEGVAFALRDCVEIAKASGVKIDSTKICGGGGKSKIWRKIVANVLGIPVFRPQIEEGPAYGGAILAMVGCGEYKTVLEATNVLIKTKDVTEPDSVLVEKYNKRYESFVKLYPALKEVYKQI